MQLQKFGNVVHGLFTAFSVAFFGFNVANYVAFFCCLAFFWTFRRANWDFLDLLNDRVQRMSLFDINSCYFCMQNDNFLVILGVNAFFIRSIVFTCKLLGSRRFKEGFCWKLYFFLHFFAFFLHFFAFFCIAFFGVPSCIPPPPCCRCVSTSLFVERTTRTCVGLVVRFFRPGCLFAVRSMFVRSTNPILYQPDTALGP